MMNIKFDLVRIGNIRKNNITEIVLRENLTLLKSYIREFLEHEECDNKYNEVHMTLVIPASGVNIKFVLQDVQDKRIKNKLRKNFPESIYKGSISTMLDNIDNKIF